MNTAKVLILFALASLLTAAAQTQTHRPKPKPTPLPNKAPSVKLVPATDRLVLAGCDDAAPAVPGCSAMSPKVKLSAQATDPDGDTLLYTYSTTGGRIDGDGPEVTFDVTGVAPGTYTATVKVDDGNGGTATDSTKIEVARCTCDRLIDDPPPCPTVTVSCPDTPGRDGRLVFKANVTGGEAYVTPTYNWTVSTGTITGGQGSGSVTVDTRGVSHGVYSATVEVGGYDRSCRTSASCTIVIEPPIQPRRIDEYGDIPRGDEKLRLDNIAVELRNDPTSLLTLICYGGMRGETAAARRRCRRAKDYLAGRGIAPERVVTLGGGRRERLTVEAWIVPSGAPPPRPTPALPTRGRR